MAVLLEISTKECLAMFYCIRSLCNTYLSLGYYLYAEASYPRVKGDKARISSPNLMPTTSGVSSCLLRFYYHLKGDHIGRLTVKTRQCTGTGCPETAVWSTNTTAGDQWVRHAVRLYSRQPFQVRQLDSSILD